jgi:hypothetical protein
MNNVETEKNTVVDSRDDLQRMTAHRDMLLAALEALLEHEGTVDYTGIGEFPSEALGQARAQALTVIAEVKGEK